MADRDVFAPVERSITVRANVQRTFEVFTAGFDSWWPRSHHIGKSPMKRAVIEGRVGGRCYSEQEDGTDCAWGQILEWDPPRRFVFSWQITPQWAFEPDLSKASEVEVRFTAVGNVETRVDLEHRHFERMGTGGAIMREGVRATGGWGTLLDLFAERMHQAT
ncbi:MAG: SRPBCC family protein [Gemmatimonadaceae bacterium]